MPFSTDRERLHALGLLYIGMVRRSDGFAGDTGLETVTRLLLVQSGHDDLDDIHRVVLDALEAYSSGEPDLKSAARLLKQELTEAEMACVLADLAEIARAGEVVAPEGQNLLETLSRAWDVVRADAGRGQAGEQWSALHDLAYIYLVLAHGVDNDLSDIEVQVILTKLREWIPDAPVEDVRRMLHRAMTEYAQGHEDGRIASAAAAVRDAMPHEQRMAALNDLVKIANADGVFLDDEEDLINRLQVAWDVDPSAVYEPHSRKSPEGG